MWLDNLKELKKSKGMTSKQISDITKIPESTIKRIFSGETDNPYVDTLHRIVIALGGSLDDIFADTKVVVGNVDLSTLHAEVNRLNSELSFMQGEYLMIKEECIKINAECEILKRELAHKEEIIALHNYYNKIKTGN